MRVSLISYTKQAEQVVASAAKLCYSPSAIDGILEGLTPEKTAGFVEMLAEIGHESPIEHACFTFGIEGVSRSLLAQITRHRIASYSVQSQRYVREVQFEYVTPPEIAADKQALTVYKAAMSAAQESYDRLSDLLKKTHKARLIAGGLDPKRADRDAEKLAIEDARFTLPNACVTKMVVTMNARSLLNFFSHRCCNRAQWEIRDLADKMLAMCVSVAPNLFKAAGPPCVRGKCAEG
ncbi:MAG: FAD-dependent thymidylate synthase, partial [Oscillospiraceae bacterium]|nr:FAD-dependent thymidylate synthase [Oscillospiraceae bacterium]